MPVNIYAFYNLKFCLIFPPNVIFRAFGIDIILPPDLTSDTEVKLVRKFDGVIIFGEKASIGGKGGGGSRIINSKVIWKTAVFKIGLSYKFKICENLD